MKVEIEYIRSVMGTLNEHVLHETKEFENKTQLMNHVRKTKKEIASECHYRFPQDVVRYVIREIEK